MSCALAAFQRVSIEANKLGDPVLANPCVAMVLNAVLQSLMKKVAASGGYLLCCTASPGRLFAAPFATVGSIGVIATQLNINKLLTNWGVQPLEFRGGKYKAPIGMVGRVSKAGERVTQTMINDVHRAFKQHVVNARPMLKNSIEKIGNGNVWLGVDAVDLGLVDSIKTSDEYIEEIIRDGTQVLKMVQAMGMEAIKEFKIVKE